MLFANPNGVQGNVVSPGVNEFIIPNYKQTWGAIRKIADAPEAVKVHDVQVGGVLSRVESSGFEPNQLAGGLAYVTIWTHAPAKVLTSANNLSLMVSEFWRCRSDVCGF